MPSNESANLQFAKGAAIVWTVLYLFAFPFLFLKALASGELLENPTLTHANALVLIVMDYAAAFIIPICLACMWVSYAKKRVLLTHIFGALPIVLFLVYIFLRLEY